MSLDTYAAKLGFTTLNESDYDDLKRSTKRVYYLMKDGEWHHAQSIITASETREGLRRMRELREHYTIESHRCSSHNRDWKYRLVPRKLNQSELFQ